MAKYEPKPPRRVEGVSAPTNAAIKTLQAESMFKMRVEGATMEEVARHHNVGVATAYRRMKWAEEQGIVEELQARVRRDLAPKALAAYESVLDLKGVASAEALETHKVKLTAAKDIAFGSGILTKDTQKARTEVEEFSLAWYHQRSANVHTEGTGDVVSVVDKPEAPAETAQGNRLGDGQDRSAEPDHDRAVIDGVVAGGAESD